MEFLYPFGNPILGPFRVPTTYTQLIEGSLSLNNLRHMSGGVIHSVSNIINDDMSSSSNFLVAHNYLIPRNNNTNREPTYDLNIGRFVSQNPYLPLNPSGFTGTNSITPSERNALNVENIFDNQTSEQDNNFK